MLMWSGDQHGHAGEYRGTVRHDHFGAEEVQSTHVGHGHSGKGQSVFLELTVV